TDFDDYGNVRAEETTTDGVNLDTTIVRTFSNDPTTWLVGLLKTQDTCSTVPPHKKCRTSAFLHDGFGQVHFSSEGTSGEPETLLGITLKRDAYGNVTGAAATDAFGRRRSACTSYDAEGIFPFAHGDAAGHI